MTLSFKYKGVSRSNKTRALTPSIPITFSGNSGKYEFAVLLDSGADISAIPRHMAELLGLELNGPTEDVFGIGGVAKAIQREVKIEFSKGHEKYSFNLPVKVILDNYDFPPLIGRAVFFDKFDITFRQSEKRVYLKAVGKKGY